MTPGEHRRLDAEVAEKVFRVKAWDGVSGWLMENPNRPTTWMFLPAYSTDIAAAWAVVEKMREHGTVIRIGPWLPGRWAAYLSYAPQYFPMPTPKETFVADTAPEAICRAALAAVEARATDSSAR